MSTRYADAVRARRAELHARRIGLTGAHRLELRSCLALSRVTATAETAAGLAALARDAAAHHEATEPATRRQLPARLAAAVGELEFSLTARWAAALRPALRRIATERSLPTPEDWPRLPGGRSPVVPPPPPEPAGALRSLLTGADGAAAWRVASIPVVALPLLGIPSVGGPALAPLAVGVGVAAVVLAARSRRTALERARLRRHTDEVLAAARVALDVDLARRLLEVERTAGAVLDLAVARRRGELDAELLRLAPDRSGTGG